MRDDLSCYATGTDKLPTSVYLRDLSLDICRGTPSEIVLQLVPSSSTLTLQEALIALVGELSFTRNLHVELPWDAPDDVLSNLIVQVLLDYGVIGPTPLA